MGTECFRILIFKQGYLFLYSIHKYNVIIKTIFKIIEWLLICRLWQM